METTKLNVACSHCLTTNRVPTDRLTDDPVCGSCSFELLAGRPIELNDASFDAITARTDIPVLVDFWASWCGPCRAMAPQFDKAALDLKGRVVFAKIDSDANPLTSRRFGIRSLPTLVRLRAGREQARQIGGLQAAQITAFAVDRS